MSYPFLELNGHRVYCGGCRYQHDQSRLEGGEFDSPIVNTYYCSHCFSVYGVCTYCGIYVPDGIHCPNLGNEGHPGLPPVDLGEEPVSLSESAEDPAIPTESTPEEHLEVQEPPAPDESAGGLDSDQPLEAETSPVQTD